MNDDRRGRLLLMLSRLVEAGIPLIELPQELLDADLLTVLHADRLVELFRRNHCHVGPQNKLIIESGWEIVSNANNPDHIPIRRVVQGEIRAEVESPELRVRIRLTTTGETEASRIRLNPPIQTASESPAEAAGQGGKGETAGAANEQIEVPALSEKQYLILETMKELGATSADTRQTCEDIATECDGTKADVNVFKPLLSDLTQLGLTDSKTGRGGGSWLTTPGAKVAERLLANRKASTPKR